MFFKESNIGMVSGKGECYLRKHSGNNDDERHIIVCLLCRYEP